MDDRSARSKRRILIADDDAAIVQVIAERLRDLDRFEVSACTSGEAARSALQQSRFDLFITDLRMPDVDGMDLIRETQGRSPETVSILMTAFGSPEVQAEAQNASARYYLEKPFNIDDLVCIIESLFPSEPGAVCVSGRSVFKVVLGGDANVGKTSLIQRHCTGLFDPSRAMTIGIDFHLYDVGIDDMPVRLVVWDMGGQERFVTVRDGFYRGSHAVGLVFDASNRVSFYNLMRWWREVRASLPDVPVVLLANKVDLPRQVSRAEVEAIAQAWQTPAFESSCVTGEGISEFFEAVARRAWKHARTGAR